jgi:hypothetical protein
MSKAKPKPSYAGEKTVEGIINRAVGDRRAQTLKPLARDTRRNNTGENQDLR